MELERLTIDEWGDALPPDGFEAFHAPEALSVMDDHTDAELRLYGGFKGQRAVALLPLFVRRPALGPEVALSPPPSLGVPYLGPVLMPASPKQKKQERLNRKFTDAVLDELELDESRTVLRILAGPEYDDPRPFVWEGMETSPEFTYRVDLDGKSMDDLLAQFDESLRDEMRAVRDRDVAVERGGLDAARRVYRDAARRPNARGNGDLTWPYVRDLVDALGDRARVYVARDSEGSYLGGAIVLYSNDTAYYWRGGARASTENVGANAALHRRILTDAVEDPPFDSVSTYDLVGANAERLGGDQPRFGGDLVRYYAVESDDATTKLAERAYRWIDRTGLKG